MTAFLKDSNTQKHPINIYNNNNNNNIEKGILHFSEERNADIIALSIHEHKDILRLFYKSLRNRVSRKSLKLALTFLPIIQ